MSVIEPAGEKIARNLRLAVERLQDDLTRVELWAGALGSFTKPIPDYGHGQTRFDLMPRTPDPSDQPSSKNRDAERPPRRSAA